jgi:hypothetical protein
MHMLSRYLNFINDVIPYILLHTTKRNLLFSISHIMISARELRQCSRIKPRID